MPAAKDNVVIPATVVVSVVIVVWGAFHWRRFSWKRGENSHQYKTCQKWRQLVFDKDSALDRLREWLFLHGGQYTIDSFVHNYCSLLRNELNIPLDRFFVGSSFAVSESFRVPYTSWKWQYKPNHGSSKTCVNSSQMPYSSYKLYLSQDAPFALLLSGRLASVRLQASPDFVPPSECLWIVTEQYQDYYALPMLCQDKNVCGALAWSTKQDGGFSPAQVEFLQESLNAVSTVMRLHCNDYFVQLLTTNEEEVMH